jgi:hypothetical protein
MKSTVSMVKAPIAPLLGSVGSPRRGHGHRRRLGGAHAAMEKDPGDGAADPRTDRGGFGFRESQRSAGALAWSPCL